MQPIRRRTRGLLPRDRFDFIHQTGLEPLERLLCFGMLVGQDMLEVVDFGLIVPGSSLLKRMHTLE